jgi:hypothetical protein
VHVEEIQSNPLELTPNRGHERSERKGTKIVYHCIAISPYRSMSPFHRGSLSSCFTPWHPAVNLSIRDHHASRIHKFKIPKSQVMYSYVLYCLQFCNPLEQKKTCRCANMNPSLHRIKPRPRKLCATQKGLVSSSSS